MAGEYEAEQAEIRKSLPELAARLEELKSNSDSADKFISVIRKYTTVEKLDAAILNELIDKIIVHHKEKSDDRRTYLARTRPTSPLFPIRRKRVCLSQKKFSKSVTSAYKMAFSRVRGQKPLRDINVNTKNLTKGNYNNARPTNRTTLLRTRFRTQYKRCSAKS